MLQKLKWESLQERRARSRVLMLYRIRFLLLITCNQSLCALDDLKQSTCRSSATLTPTVNPSFLTQSVCGTLCLSMSASWHLTASRLVRAPSSLFSCLRSCFYHTVQALILSCSSSSFFTAQLSRHATVLYSRCDIAQYEFGTFPGRRRRRGSIFDRNIFGGICTKQAF